jgi:transcriptional regulator with XRE-family HTH domain
MNAVTPPPSNDGLAAKIARLVEERGWNQEDFARITKLNRQTVRQILLNQGRKPHNATVQACAKALGLTVGELRALPLDRLIPRMHGQSLPEGEETLKRLYERSAQPELRGWLDRNTDRARQLTPAEVDELLASQEEGTLSRVGVERFIELLERRRRLVERVRAVAGSEYLDLLERFVELLYEKVRPS